MHKYEVQRLRVWVIWWQVRGHPSILHVGVCMHALVCVCVRERENEMKRAVGRETFVKQACPVDASKFLYRLTIMRSKKAFSLSWRLEIWRDGTRPDTFTATVQPRIKKNSRAWYPILWIFHSFTKWAITRFRQSVSDMRLGHEQMATNKNDTLSSASLCFI